MLNLDKAIRILEFDKIRLLLSSIAMTEGARKKSLVLLPSSNELTVKKRQALTSDAKHISSLKGAPSFNNMPEILEIVDKAEKGSILSPREILDIASSLTVSRVLLEYIHTDAVKPCNLLDVFENLVSNKTLEDAIKHDILGEDLIADDASPVLSDIRRKIRYQTNRIREVLQSFLTGDKAKHLRESLVTMRNGRYVLPVKNEDKNEIKGLIHDTSGTGSTLFIEPLAVVEANNELRTLVNAESIEIERILSEYSNKISEISYQLRNNYYNITEIAFTFACAELAFKMNAIEPTFSNKKEISYIQARHPLLDNKTVVPIDVSLGIDYKMLVITGPNTGGKTVTLKTLGLFSLMAQSGLQLPCDKASLCVLDGIFPDIGDEQSIEQSLSTFSSHIVSITDILKNASEHSLILFDELGAGTDPIEGAALAQSILENVLDKGCMCAATTHYAELKAFALNTEGVSNASCEFDVNTLKPTYKLIIGTPGKSNAFLISQRLGIDNSIISRAKDLLSNDARSFESVIEKLDITRLELENEKNEASRLRKEFEKFKQESELELEKRLSNAKKDSDDMLNKARQMISGARASADLIFEKLDKLEKEKNSKDFSKIYGDSKKEIRSLISKADDKYNPVIEIKDDYVLPRNLVKGDRVVFKDSGVDGVVISIPDRKGKVLVQTGNISTKTEISRLMLATDLPKKKEKKTPAPITQTGLSSMPTKSFSPSFDVRGFNIEEAWQDIDKYLDDAMIYGVNSVTIIHGKGTGALRTGLWTFFKRDQRIKSFRNGNYGEGDHGVTIIELK
ncbi:MAG: endonuclease MutS2 [Clostridia bacterium]|nr:endonuclease MutS2 [Clostridia bacterium]